MPQLVGSVTFFVVLMLRYRTSHAVEHSMWNSLILIQAGFAARGHQIVHFCERPMLLHPLYGISVSDTG
jgi:hypothetical protein